MDKNEFIKRRTEIISRMLDNPVEGPIYPTGVCYAELDDLYDEITGNQMPSWAQIDRNNEGKLNPVARAKMMDDGILCCRCGLEIYLESCGYSRLCGECYEEVSK